MSDKKKSIGKIGWFDLTVDNADSIKDFYSAVVGWEAKEFDMGEYSDYTMNIPETDICVAGICNKKGTNAEIPSNWMMYITVADIEQSSEAVIAKGGKLLTKIKNMGESSRYVFIQDPSGAVCALFQE